MKVLYKVISGNTQVHVGRCFLVGVLFTHTGTNDIKVYDEASADTTGAQLVVWLKGGSPSVSIVFPKDREPELVGIYAVYGAGTAVIYYHL